MKCKTVIDEYCKIDKNSNLPIKISIHLMHCKSCRKSISKMSNCYAAGTKIKNILPENNPIIKNTMQKIKSIKQNQTEIPILLKDRFAFTPWIISGIIIIIAFIALPYSSLGKWLINNLGIAFSLPFGLSCAGTITIFCAVFIFRNSDFFIKKLDL